MLKSNIIFIKIHWDKNQIFDLRNEWLQLYSLLVKSNSFSSINHGYNVQREGIRMRLTRVFLFRVFPVSFDTKEKNDATKYSDRLISRTHCPLFRTIKSAIFFFDFQRCSRTRICITFPRRKIERVLCLLFKHMAAR